MQRCPFLIIKTINIYTFIFYEEFYGPLITKGYDSEAQLVLNVPPMPHGRSRIKEVLYSEPVKSLNQYKGISIYSGEALIARLEDIEVLV